VVRFTEDDFGITHLAIMFNQDWRRLGGASEVVAEYVSQASEDYVRAVLDDAFRLLVADDDDMIDVLWATATGGYHRLQADEMSGTAWARKIIEVCNRRFSLEGVSIQEGRAAESYRMGMSSVIREIEDIDQVFAVSTSRDHSPEIAEIAMLCASVRP
jgi:hypothetical protein